MSSRTFIGLARARTRNEFILLTGIANKDGRKWVAVCQETGTATNASTVDEAIRRLSEAVELHLETLEDVGELDRFLEEQGINIRKSRPRQTRLNVPSMTPGSVATTLVKKLPGHARRSDREPVIA